MDRAYDIFAEVNPAFYCTLLTSFLRGFASVDPLGPEVVTAYLALPIVTSGQLRSTFNQTNKKTGLREWLFRSPQIRIGLPELLNQSMPIVTDALRFGCFVNALSIGGDGRLKIGRHAAPEKVSKTVNDASVADAIRLAHRFGVWIATSGSTRVAFEALGLEL